MGILPFPQFAFVPYVLVGDVDPSRKGHFIVYDHYFSVVSEIEREQEVVQANGHYGMDVHTNVLEMFFGAAPQVVTSKGIINDPNLDAFSNFPFEEVQHFIQEVAPFQNVVLYVDEFLGFFHGLEERIEGFTAILEYGDLVPVGGPSLGTGMDEVAQSLFSNIVPKMEVGGGMGEVFMPAVAPATFKLFTVEKLELPSVNAKEIVQ